MPKANDLGKCQSRRMEQHRRATEMAFNLARRKNAEYGDAIAQTGIAGCAISVLLG